MKCEKLKKSDLFGEQIRSVMVVKVLKMPKSFNTCYADQSVAINVVA